MTDWQALEGKPVDYYIVNGPSYEDMLRASRDHEPIELTLIDSASMQRNKLELPATAEIMLHDEHPEEPLLYLEMVLQMKDYEPSWIAQVIYSYKDEEGRIWELPSI